MRERLEVIESDSGGKIAYRDSAAEPMLTRNFDWEDTGTDFLSAIYNNR